MSRLLVCGLLVGVGLLAAVRYSRQRALRQEQARITGLIRPPRYVFTDVDEGARERALERWGTAEELRRRAALVNSGDCVLRSADRRRA